MHYINLWRLLFAAYDKLIFVTMSQWNTLWRFLVGINDKHLFFVTKPPYLILIVIKWNMLMTNSSDVTRNSSQKVIFLVVLAAWDLVCQPKKKGGLGVINLELQNIALLLKHLDKFYNKKDLPWVNLIWDKYYSNSVLPPHAHVEKGSFWWKDVLRLTPIFRAISLVKVGLGVLMRKTHTGLEDLLNFCAGPKSCL